MQCTEKHEMLASTSPENYPGSLVGLLCAQSERVLSFLRSFSRAYEAGLSGVERRVSERGNRGRQALLLGRSVSPSLPLYPGRLRTRRREA
jgi:hypothetical protein